MCDREARERVGKTLAVVNKTTIRFCETLVRTLLTLDFNLVLSDSASFRCFNTAPVQSLCDRSDPAKGESVTKDPVAKPSRWQKSICLRFEYSTTVKEHVLHHV